jgi:hypothetical protein
MVEPPKENFSPVLKAALKEVERVYAKYDLGGVVVLADGKGFSEYKLIMENPRPTWSMISFKRGAVHVKGYMRSKPDETAATVNMVAVSMDTLAFVFQILDNIMGRLKEVMQIETSEFKFTPHKPE